MKNGEGQKAAATDRAGPSSRCLRIFLGSTPDWIPHATRLKRRLEAIHKADKNPVVPHEARVPTVSSNEESRHMQFYLVRAAGVACWP